MKRLLLISFLCAYSAISVLSQTKGQITQEKKRYYLNDKQLTGKELQATLKSVPESAVIYKKAMQNMTIGLIALGIGTGFTLYSAANPPKEDGNFPGTISDEEMKKWMGPIYIAGGCILASIPFLFAGKSQIKKSISIYNSKQATGFNSNQKLELGITQNGVGITFHF